MHNLGIYLNYNFDPSHPGVRLRRLNLRKPLRQLSVDCDIIYRYEDLWSYTNILFSNCNQASLDEIIKLRNMGKKVFFCHSEALWRLPYQEEIFNLCDYIVCCSKTLAELTQARLYSDFTKCVVIPDMIEDPSVYHTPVEKENLSLVYCGMGGNSYLAKRLKPIIEDLGMSLTIISEHADANIKWNRDTYLSEMAKHDIVLVPSNVEKQPAKSNIKVAVALGLGMPFICSPNPAYLEMIGEGAGGYVACTNDDWKRHLIALKSYDLRQKLHKNNLNHARIAYFPTKIAQKWLDLLQKCHESPKIALVYNTLQQKYITFGDKLLDDLRMSGQSVTVFRHEDIDYLPNGYDMYLFIEVRYDPEDISDVKPRILLTKEDQNLNNLPHFHKIITTNQGLADKWSARGFINSHFTPTFDHQSIQKVVNLDTIALRKDHNERIHSQHIDSFWKLQLPEDRWDSERDRLHIDFTLKYAKPQSKILDIGSADGWLCTFLAKEGHQVTGLDFVERGLAWTQQQAERLGVKVETKFGFIEDLTTVFSSLKEQQHVDGSGCPVYLSTPVMDRVYQKFDLILAYEILEHLHFSDLPWYLNQMESLLTKDGKILISLPKQDLNDNVEHLFSPSRKLIDKVFSTKKNLNIEWINIPNHGVPGNWFISYTN